MTNHLNQIQIFETQDGQINLEVRLQDDTVWLSTEQMSSLFARERSVLTKHINNVFKEAELEQNGNVQNLHIAHSDKPIKLYSLDVIISVGYRVKSARGVLFRKWATQTLKQHLVQGYTLYDSRAVRVNWQGYNLGYLPRLDNAAVAQLLDRGEMLDAAIAKLEDSSNPWDRVGVRWQM